MDGETGGPLGWGAISYGGVLDYRKANPGAERLLHFYREIGMVIREWEPERAALEDYFLGLVNRKTTMVLAEQSGTVRMLLARRRVPFAVWGPGEWKAAVFGRGKGGAKKAAVRGLAVERWPRWGREMGEMGEDELDAWCIAQAEWGVGNGGPEGGRQA